MTNRDRVLQAISEATEERRRAGRLPVHVLFYELRLLLPDITEEELRQTLNGLRKEKAIGTGRTINDTYITLD